MRLYKRQDTWWAVVYDSARKRHRISTKCHDRKAAEAFARRAELSYTDASAALLRSATLSQALDLLVKKREEQARLGTRSPETATMYRRKSGHLIRILEHHNGVFAPFPLAQLHARDVDRYIQVRSEEGAAGNTITKELVTLRASLKLAARAGLWSGSLLAVLPAESVNDYKPRTRWLTEEEVHKLLAQLTGDHAARVAFIVATSANRRETELARRDHVSPNHDFVEIHGTKTAWRSRTVPMVTPILRRYLEYALEHAQGFEGALFRPWGNMNRDIAEACERAGIPRCSPNDLRRTCATWLRSLGLPPDLIAAVLGHRDTRMVERVYGRLSPELLAQRMRSALGSENCDTGVPAIRAETAKGGDTGEITAPNLAKQVPRAGIEPATRGFSVPCSTN